MPRAKGLTAKQRMFVAEFLVDRNGTQAAVRAGYSEDTAYSIAHRLLRKDEIKAAIDKAESMRAERLEITADRVAVELARISFADLREITYVKDGKLYCKDTDALTDEQAAAIAELIPTPAGVRVRLHPKAQALDQLGKILGLHRTAIDLKHVGLPPVLQFVPAAKGEPPEPDAD